MNACSCRQVNPCTSVAHRNACCGKFSIVISATSRIHSISTKKNIILLTLCHPGLHSSRTHYKPGSLFSFSVLGHMPFSMRRHAFSSTVAAPTALNKMNFCASHVCASLSYFCFHSFCGRWQLTQGAFADQETFDISLLIDT